MGPRDSHFPHTTSALRARDTVTRPAPRGRRGGDRDRRPSGRPPADRPRARARAAGGRNGVGVRQLGLLLLVMVLTATAYAGVLGHAFLTWDDPDYVSENALVQHHDTGTLLRAVVSSNYHPLTMLSLSWNASVPLSPRPFLVTNVALHAINAGLVFWLVFLLAGGRLFPAFWAALFFGIHPMHVESVAWISERKDVLYVAFFLAAAIAYWRYLTVRTQSWLAVTFVLFLLSCFAKGMAVVFPLVLMLLDVWQRRLDAFSGAALLEKIPFFAVSLLFGWIAIQVQGAGNLHGLLIRTDYHLKGLADSLPLTALERIVLPAYGLFLYSWRLFLPIRQSAFYPYPSGADAAAIHTLLGPIFLIALVALAIWDFRRTRLWTFGVGWYLVALAPVLQWIPVGDAIIADRYTYLSYVGPLFAIAVAVERLAAKRTGGIAFASVLFGIVAAMFFALTVRQAKVWKDSETLWTNVIRRYPRNEMAYVARGNARGASGRIDDAFRDLLVARGLGSKRGNLYDGLGNAFGSKGQLDSAVVMYDRGLALEPNMGRTYYNRAIAYLRLQRPADALSDLQRARMLVPAQTLDFHVPSGNAYLQLKRYQEAVAQYDSAIGEGQRDPNLYYSRALGRWNLGDSTGAGADLNEARRLYGARAGTGTAGAGGGKVP